jgi:hypothetical protein
MTPRILLSLATGRYKAWAMPLALALAMTLVGCGDFNDGKTRNIIEANPVKLDAEQVILSDGEVACGVENELWDAPSPAGSRTTARLTQKGET